MAVCAMMGMAAAAYPTPNAAFKAVRGSKPGGGVVAEHVFTSSVPVPGEERFRINLYDFQRGPLQVQQGAEVVVDAFTFTP